MSEALPQPPPANTAAYWPGTTANGPTDQNQEKPVWQKTGKKLGDLLTQYARRTHASKTWRHKEYEATWRRLIDLYRGRQLQGMPTTEDRIVINIAFSTVNVIVPSIAVNNPNITVNERSPQQAANAQSAEGLINYWWRHFDWKSEVKRSVKDSIQIGHGWAKVGWIYTEKSRDATPEELQGQFQQQQAQVNQAALANPAIAADLPSDEDIYDSLVKEIWEVEKDHPFVHRVSPFDILVDPEATYYGDLKWIAQEIIVPIEQVKNDDRYEADGRNALQPDMSSNPRWRDQNETDRRKEKVDDDIQRCTIYEYWDITNEYYCVFAKDAKKFLVKPTANPYPFPHPFFFLPNYEVMDQFYPIGDLEMIEPIQHELNGVRSDMMNHRKRWQRAYLALRDKLSPEAIAALGSDEDGRVIWVDGDEELQRIVVPLQQTALDPQMYQYSEQIEADLDLVSGVTEYQRGSAPEIRRTATEAQLLQNATNARVSDKLAQVEKFMADIARAIVQLAQIYMSQPEAARLVGQNGQVTWGQFTPEEIQGEFDFEVEAGSTQPKDESVKRQEAMQVLQVLAPYVGAVIDPQALVTYVLKNGLGIQSPEQFFPQQPQQQQGPSTKLIESMNYKDAPPDIQRQIEAEAGFQPSQVGGVSKPEQNLQDQQHSHEQLALQHSQEDQQQLQQQAADAAKEQGAQQHDLTMAVFQAQENAAARAQEHEQILAENAAAKQQAGPKVP